VRIDHHVTGAGAGSRAERGEGTGGMKTFRLVWELVSSLSLIGLASFFVFYALKHKPLDPADVYFTMAILLMSVAGREHTA
jgi:hypothetical protein